MSSTTSSDVVILSAARTPIGKLNGSLSSLRASDLGSIVIQDGLKRAGIEATHVSEVLMGQVLTAGEWISHRKHCVEIVCTFLHTFIGGGQNPARQASMKAGVPKEVPSTCINMLCGSGLKAVAQGCQAIKCGDASVIVAGGQESMSQVCRRSVIRLKERVCKGQASICP